MGLIEIKGKRLTLREISKDDLPQLLLWRNSEIFQKSCLSYSKDCTIEELDREIDISYRQDKYAQFIAWTSDDKPVGTNWIYRYHKTNGIGFTTTFVDEQYRQSHYYAIEMFALICKYMFNELACRKIYSEVHAGNTSSMNIFNKLKLPLEATFKNHSKVGLNDFEDLLVYALYKEAFESMNIPKKLL